MENGAKAWHILNKGLQALAKKKFSPYHQYDVLS